MFIVTFPIEAFWNIENFAAGNIVILTVLLSLCCFVFADSYLSITSETSLKFCKSISESKLSSFGNSSTESVLTVLLFKQSLLQPVSE
jgi:Na+/H+-dicarboxylate symporter